jgi:hypothetical protein
VKKIRLDIDALVVDTFRAGPDGGGRGTVHGQQPTYGESCTCYDCGDSGFYYSCVDTNCPSGCLIILCDTYEQCVEWSNVHTCGDTCGGCGTAIGCNTSSDTC